MYVYVYIFVSIYNVYIYIYIIGAVAILSDWILDHTWKLETFSRAIKEKQTFYYTSGTFLLLFLKEEVWKIK